MTRATFDVRLTGEPAAVEQAATDLADRLTEAGYFHDEDFETLYGKAWAVIGLRLRTAAAVRAALDLLPCVGVYLVETNAEDDGTRAVTVNLDADARNRNWLKKQS